MSNEHKKYARKMNLFKNIMTEQKKSFYLSKVYSTKSQEKAPERSNYTGLAQENLKRAAASPLEVHLF